MSEDKRVFEIGPNGVTDLSARPKTTAIKFRDVVSGQEVLIQVHDRAPELGDVHVEGRRVIVSSVEHYVELAGKAGWFPVDPNETEETREP